MRQGVRITTLEGSNPSASALLTLLRMVIRGGLR